MKTSTFIWTRIGHLRNAKLSRPQLEAQQLRKFRRLVAHAVGRAPYYRALVETHGIDVTTCRPANFPVLTKSQIMNNFDEIVTDRTITKDRIADFLSVSKDPFDLFDGKYYVVHTSGTSGEVGYFVYSLADWTRGIAHALRVTPIRRGKRRMAFFGATQGHFTGVTLVVSSLRSITRFKYDVATFEINSPLAPIIERLNAFQPDILYGYASALAILAERQRQGRLRISPKWVQSSGEPLHAADRTLIEETFGIPVFNVYITTEHLFMGLSKPGFDGMYLFEDDLIFELMPDHTLITNLFNYTLPLIRYRMSDVLVATEDTINVFPFSKVKEIIGRSELTPVFTNRHGQDDFISPHIVNEFVVKNVRRFQLQLVDKTSCIFRVCLDDGLRDEQQSETLDEVRARFGEILAEKEMTNVSFDIEQIDELLPNEKTGKFQLVVPPPLKPEAS